MNKIYPVLRRFVALSVLGVILLGVFERALAVDVLPTTLISKNAAGTSSGNGESGTNSTKYISMSGDGNRVAFTANATDLTNVPVMTWPSYSHLYLYDDALGTLTMIDKNVSGTGSGNSTASSVRISDDGSHVAFMSASTNLTAIPDTIDLLWDIYVYDVATDTVTLVSKNPAGTSAANGRSTGPSISADGSRIVFTSYATDLTANPDGNSDTDVFLYEVATDTVTLISHALGGSSTANDGSSGAIISADGSTVIFESNAANLTAVADSNAAQDVFMYDIASGTTTLISTNSAGTAPANGPTYARDLSADGGLILLLSHASDPGGGLWIYDVLTDTKTRIGSSTLQAEIAADGSRVVFVSNEDGLTTDPSLNGSFSDVYLYDVQTGTIQLISLNAAGTSQGNKESTFLGNAISADGNRIYFQSHATDLTSDPTIPNRLNTYLYDLPTDTLIKVSRNRSGGDLVDVNTYSLATGIAADGSTLLINSFSPNLTYDIDTNFARDVFRVKIATLPDTPTDIDAPTDLSATPTSQTRIDLSWADQSIVETSFRIERSPNGVDGWVEIGANTADDTTFSDKSAACNTTYHYRVRAHRSGTNTYSNFANSVEASTWTCSVFVDVPVGYWAQDWIEDFYEAAITSGCGAAPSGQPLYCPEREVTRAETAVFLIRALHYANLPYTPTDPDDHFDDVPVATKEWMRPWIEEFYDLGITGGCAANPLRYCPERAVTRAEMAVFILRALEGGSYQPPAASHYFDDVPVTGKGWMEAWIDEFYRRGITGGCGLDAENDLIFCPEREVTRAEMAVFILRAFWWITVA